MTSSPELPEIVHPMERMTPVPVSCAPAPSGTATGPTTAVTDHSAATDLGIGVTRTLPCTFPTDMTGWWTASYIVLWILVIVLSVLLLSLARQVGTLHLRLGPRGALELDEEGPPLGEAIPPANVSDREGNQVTVGGPGAPQFLLFVSPGCPICREVTPSLPVVARVGSLTPYLISDSEEPSAAHEYASLGRGSPLVVGSNIAQSYRVPGTPYAVILDGFGVVRAKGTVNNLEQMEGLVDTAQARLHDALPAAHDG
jgi:methylamine dehydrogenase accessory protein MauD